MQFIKFGLVGVSNTLISEGVYTILIFFKMHYIPASFIGFSLSVINAFYWNQKYVFVDEGKHKWQWRIFMKTYLAYLGSYLLSVVLLILWIDIVHIADWLTGVETWTFARGYYRLDKEFMGQALAAFLNLLLTVPLNFLANKYWAFRKR